MEKHKIFYLIIGIAVIFMLVHIEVILAQKIAPENILIQVKDSSGRPETNATCLGDISSEIINVENKPLEWLNSIYDFLDASTYYSPEEKGFYILNTGFSNYKGEYDIKIVCYSPNFSGVSYTIINNTNSLCEVKENGKYLVC